MSMPAFPTVRIGREDAVSYVLASIAMEELALSHILNAEGEKIQHVLGTLPGQTPPSEATIAELRAVDELVVNMLTAVRQTQAQLMEKMRAALDADTGGTPE